jgi:hypothetical protein
VPSSSITPAHIRVALSSPAIAIPTGLQPGYRAKLRKLNVMPSPRTLVMLDDGPGRFQATWYSAPPDITDGPKS